MYIYLIVYTYRYISLSLCICLSSLLFICLYIYIYIYIYIYRIRNGNANPKWNCEFHRQLKFDAVRETSVAHNFERRIPWDKRGHPPCARLEPTKNSNWCARQASDLQESLGIRNENVNLMCPSSAIYARIARDTQHHCEFDMAATGLQCKNYLGYTAKMRVVCARQAPYLQESLGIRSENATLMCPSSAIYARIARDTQQ